LAKLINYGGNYLQSFYNPEEKSESHNLLTSSSFTFPTDISQTESLPPESEAEFDFTYDEDDIDTTGFSGSFTLHNKNEKEQNDEN